MVRRSVCGLLLVLFYVAGCRSRDGATTTDPEAKLRLERILEAYTWYIQDHRKGPPDEKTFLAYLRKLPAEKHKRLQVGDDIDSLMTSPRDGQRYVIRYNLANLLEGDTRAVAWEHTGYGGKRFVALNMGYVEEYREEDFNELKK
jgi:hypothetical protein